MHDFLASPLTLKNRRPENQDAFGHYETPYGSLFIVCDGFGGAGAQAARSATSAYPRLLTQAHERGMDAPAALKAVTAAVHQRLAKKAADSQAPEYGSGTTVVLGLHTPKGVLVGHVGDSRAYAVTAQGASPLTRDHNKVSAMVDEGRLTEEEARRHPEAHVLTRALGAQAAVELDLRPQPVTVGPGEGLLFCTDGLCGFVDHAAMSQCLNGANFQEAPQALARLAMERGGDDNITILYLQQPEASAVQSPPPAPAQAKPSVPLPPVVNAAAPDLEFPSGSPGRQSKPVARPQLTPSHSEPAPKRPRVVPEKRGAPWWLYAAGLAAALLFTWFHFKTLWGFSFHDLSAAVEDPMVEEEVATDVEYAEDYDWKQEICRETMVGQIRTAAADFERELREAAALSSAQEMEMGDQFAAELADYYGDKLDGSAAWVKYLNELGGELLQYTTRTDITYTFHYVDEDVLNAYAMPGGHIYVFRGLLDKLVDNEAQLVYLLGHEITHVDLKHCVALMNMLEQVPGMNADIQATIGKYLQHPFSVDYEREADRNALTMVLQSGYSPFQGGILMERFAEARGFDMEAAAQEPDNIFGAILEEAASIFDTHPNPRLRLCTYKNLILQNLKTDPQPYYYVGRENYLTRTTRKEKVY